MAPWNHSPKGSSFRLFLEINFEGVLRASGASAHAETIGNVRRFVHAKYGANLQEKRLFRDHFFCFENILWGLSALRAPTVHGKAIESRPVHRFLLLLPLLLPFLPFRLLLLVLLFLLLLSLSLPFSSLCGTLDCLASVCSLFIVALLLPSWYPQFVLSLEPLSLLSPFSFRCGTLHLYSFRLPLRAMAVDHSVRVGFFKCSGRRAGGSYLF